MENNNRIEIDGDYPDGNWCKFEYDSNGNIIYFEESNGYWVKRQYDSNNNEIYYENSNGEWEKSEYDSNGNEIYWENSIGYSERYILPTPEDIKQYIDNGK